MNLAINANAAQAAAREVEKRLKAIARELDGKRWTTTIALPREQERKLSWFNEGTRRQPARPILTVNKVARGVMVTAVRERFGAQMREGRGEPSMLAALTVGAYALRRLWVQRFDASGGDITLAPLSVSWARTKRRRNLDPRIGRATGALAAAMARGQMITRKA